MPSVLRFDSSQRHLQTFAKLKLYYWNNSDICYSQWLETTVQHPTHPPHCCHKFHIRPISPELQIYFTDLEIAFACLLWATGLALLYIFYKPTVALKVSRGQLSNTTSTYLYTILPTLLNSFFSVDGILPKFHEFGLATERLHQNVNLGDAPSVDYFNSFMWVKPQTHVSNGINITLSSYNTLVRLLQSRVAAGRVFTCPTLVRSDGHRYLRSSISYPRAVYRNRQAVTTLHRTNRFSDALNYANPRTYTCTTPATNPRTEAYILATVQGQANKIPNYSVKIGYYKPVSQVPRVKDTTPTPPSVVWKTQYIPGGNSYLAKRQTRSPNLGSWREAYKEQRFRYPKDRWVSIDMIYNFFTQKNFLISGELFLHYTDVPYRGPITYPKQFTWPPKPTQPLPSVEFKEQKVFTFLNSMPLHKRKYTVDKSSSPTYSKVWETYLVSSRTTDGHHTSTDSIVALRPWPSLNTTLDFKPNLGASLRQVPFTNPRGTKLGMPLPTWWDAHCSEAGRLLHCTIVSYQKRFVFLWRLCSLVLAVLMETYLQVLLFTTFLYEQTNTFITTAPSKATLLWGKLSSEFEVLQTRLRFFAMSAWSEAVTNFKLFAHKLWVFGDEIMRSLVKFWELLGQKSYKDAILTVFFEVPCRIASARTSLKLTYLQTVCRSKGFYKLAKKFFFCTTRTVVSAGYQRLLRYWQCLKVLTVHLYQNAALTDQLLIAWAYDLCQSLYEAMCEALVNVSYVYQTTVAANGKGAYVQPPTTIQFFNYQYRPPHFIRPTLYNTLGIEHDLPALYILAESHWRTLQAVGFWKSYPQQGLTKTYFVRWPKASVVILVKAITGAFLFFAKVVLGSATINLAVRPHITVFYSRRSFEDLKGDPLLGKITLFELSTLCTRTTYKWLVQYEWLWLKICPIWVFIPLLPDKTPHFQQTKALLLAGVSKCATNLVQLCVTFPD